MTGHQTRLERRRQILDAALDLFTHQGFEPTTVEQIAEAAGLSKGAIYWHFESKVEVLLALTDRFVEESVTMLSELVHSSDFGPDALYLVHWDYWNKETNQQACNKLFAQLAALADTHPAVRERFLKYHQMRDEAGADLIQESIDRGEFKPVDAKILSQAIGGMYAGLFMRRHIDPDLDPVAIITMATRLFFEALIIRK